MFDFCFNRSGHTIIVCPLLLKCLAWRNAFRLVHQSISKIYMNLAWYIKTCYSHKHQINQTQFSRKKIVFSTAGSCIFHNIHLHSISKENLLKYANIFYCGFLIYLLSVFLFLSPVNTIYVTLDWHPLLCCWSWHVTWTSLCQLDR